MQRQYQKLVVWQSAMDLVATIYTASKRFPKSEQFGLTSQMRRAAISFPSNIAEGSSRGSDKDFNRFLNIAQGSLTELETQILIAKRLSYLNDESQLLEHTNRVFAMIVNLKTRLKASDVQRQTSSPKL